MIPGGHSIALQPVPSSQATPQVYTDTTPESGLSQYLEPEQQKQFYYQQKQPQQQQRVQYIQVSFLTGFETQRDRGTILTTKAVLSYCLLEVWETSVGKNFLCFI